MLDGMQRRRGQVDHFLCRCRREPKKWTLTFAARTMSARWVVMPEVETKLFGRQQHYLGRRMGLRFLGTALTASLLPKVSSPRMHYAIALAGGIHPRPASFRSPPTLMLISRVSYLVSIYVGINMIQVQQMSLSLHDISQNCPIVSVLPLLPQHITHAFTIWIGD